MVAFEQRVGGYIKGAPGGVGDPTRNAPRDPRSTAPPTLAATSKPRSLLKYILGDQWSFLIEELIALHTSPAIAPKPAAAASPTIVAAVSTLTSSPIVAVTPVMIPAATPLSAPAVPTVTATLANAASPVSIQDHQG